PTPSSDSSINSPSRRATSRSSEAGSKINSAADGFTVSGSGSVWPAVRLASGSGKSRSGAGTSGPRSALRRATVRSTSRSTSDRLEHPASRPQGTRHTATDRRIQTPDGGRGDQSGGRAGRLWRPSGGLRGGEVYGRG